jgi:hypothetical protein
MLNWVKQGEIMEKYERADDFIGRKAPIETPEDAFDMWYTENARSLAYYESTWPGFSEGLDPADDLTLEDFQEAFRIHNNTKEFLNEYLYYGI